MQNLNSNEESPSSSTDFDMGAWKISTTVDPMLKAATWKDEYNNWSQYPQLILISYGSYDQCHNTFSNLIWAKGQKKFQ